MKDYDVIIIGGGIIGCAIAKSIISKTKKKVLVLEKENHVGEHASSRNSGVIHSGFYYKPNSLKARRHALLSNPPDQKKSIVFPLSANNLTDSNIQSEKDFLGYSTKGIQGTRLCV